MKSTIVVSRKWNSPIIRAHMSADEIGATMNLDDAIYAMVEEMGSPAMVMSKDSLVKKLLAAWEVVAKEMKESTRFV